jgi:hypothetical protein
VLPEANAAMVVDAPLEDRRDAGARAMVRDGLNIIFVAVGFLLLDSNSSSDDEAAEWCKALTGAEYKRR